MTGVFSDSISGDLANIEDSMKEVSLSLLLSNCWCVSAAEMRLLNARKEMERWIMISNLLGKNERVSTRSEKRMCLVNDQ